jgi:hypothetical protein
MEINGGDDIYAWIERHHDAADHVLCVVSDEYLRAPATRWQTRLPAEVARRLEDLSSARERADARGGIHAETSCLEVSRQAAQRYGCVSIAARCAEPPVQLGPRMARGGLDWAIGLRIASPKS